jgi:hypothetical protein
MKLRPFSAVRAEGSAMARAAVARHQRTCRHRKHTMRLHSKTYHPVEKAWNFVWYCTGRVARGSRCRFAVSALCSVRRAEALYP